MINYIQYILSNHQWHEEARVGDYITPIWRHVRFWFANWFNLSSRVSDWYHMFKLISRTWIEIAIFNLGMGVSMCLHGKHDDDMAWQRFPLYWSFLVEKPLNTLRPSQNGRNFADVILKYVFLNEMFKFRLKCHWSLFLWSNWQYSSIGSDNGLAPIRRQAIIWTNDDLCCWKAMRSSWCQKNDFIQFRFGRAVVSGTMSM